MADLPSVGPATTTPRIIADPDDPSEHEYSGDDNLSWSLFGCDETWTFPTTVAGLLPPRSLLTSGSKTLRLLFCRRGWLPIRSLGRLRGSFFNTRDGVTGYHPDLGDMPPGSVVLCLTSSPRPTLVLRVRGGASRHPARRHRLAGNRFKRRNGRRGLG